MLLFALLALLIPSIHVSAHASLTGTTPEDGAVLEIAPTEVVLHFSEPVGPVEGETALFSDGGGNSEDGPISLEARASDTSVIVPLPDGLTDGAYLLQWRVISADSHPIGGTVSFSVGESSGTPVIEVPEETSTAGDVANAVVQALAYLGMFLASGITLFCWMITPLKGAAAWRGVLVGSVAAIVALALLVPLTTIRQTGGELRDLLTAGPWRESATRDPLIMAIVGSLGLLLLLMLYPRARRRDIGWWAPSVAGLAALVSLPIVGHTRSKEPVIVMILMDVTHVVVGALWFGGMIALLLYLRATWSGTNERDDDEAANVVARYSGVAGLIVPVIAISGASMALIIFDGWDAVTGTTYGTTLIAKIAVVVVIVLVAAWNRFRLVPAVAGRDAGSAMPWLRRTVAAEALLLAVVLVLSGSLVMNSPVVSEEAPDTVESAATEFKAKTALGDDHTVELWLEPAGTGENSAVVVITDSEGLPVMPTEPVELSWSLPERDLGPITVVLEGPDQTGASTGSVTLPFGGTWSVEIQGRIDRFTDSRTTIEVPIPDTP